MPSRNPPLRHKKYMVKKIEKKVEEEEVLETVEETNEEVIEDTHGIKINDNNLPNIRELPLIVELPAGASKAQVEFCKTINAYAYKNPTKWEQKKAKLIKQLIALKNAPDPIESNLKYGKSNL